MARKSSRIPAKRKSHDYQSARDYLLSKPDAELDYPFGPDVGVPKIRGKMFATLGEEEGVGRVNLKCDPQEALFLRETFTGVLPGYHMNKVHWNTIVLDGSIPNGEIERMIDNSYALVVKSLKKAERVMLETRHGKDRLYPASAGTLAAPNVGPNGNPQ